MFRDSSARVGRACVSRGLVWRVGLVCKIGCLREVPEAASIADDGPACTRLIRALSRCCDNIVGECRKAVQQTNLRRTTTRACGVTWGPDKERQATLCRDGYRSVERLHMTAAATTIRLTVQLTSR